MYKYCLLPIAYDYEGRITFWMLPVGLHHSVATGTPRPFLSNHRKMEPPRAAAMAATYGAAAVGRGQWGAINSKGQRRDQWRGQYNWYTVPYIRFPIYLLSNIGH